MDHTGAILELPRHEALQPCYVVLPTGGGTLVEVEHPSGLKYSVRARCSDDDNFQYSTGTRVALGRCLDLMEFDFMPKIKFHFGGTDYLVAAEAADRGSFVRFRGSSPRALRDADPVRIGALGVMSCAPQDHSCFPVYPAEEFLHRAGHNVDHTTWTPKIWSAVDVPVEVQPA